MDAINRTGVDGFLNAFRAVTILTNRSGATEMRLHNKRIPRNVGAVAATDADGFVHPNRSFAKLPP